MQTRYKPKGPGPARPATTAVFNWWSVRTWRSTTKSLRIMGSDPRPVKEASDAFSSKRYSRKGFIWGARSTRSSLRLRERPPQQARKRGGGENRNGRHIEFPGGEKRAAGDDRRSEQGRETFGVGPDDDPNDGPHHAGNGCHGSGDSGHDERMSGSGIDRLQQHNSQDSRGSGERDDRGKRPGPTQN